MMKISSLALDIGTLMMSLDEIVYDSFGRRTPES